MTAAAFLLWASLAAASPLPAGPLPEASPLWPILDGYEGRAGALKAELRALGEREFFERRLRPDLPRPTAEQAELLLSLRRYLPALDPASFFFIPEGHPFHDPQRYGYTLSLFDRAGRDRPYVFIMDEGGPDFRSVGTIIHEHMHQKQVPLAELVRRLEGATGIPRRFLWGAALRFQEGNAQLLTKNYLGLILTSRGDPFSAKLRRWLAEAAEVEGELDDHAALQWLEELAVQRHAYASEMEAARAFPDVPSSGAPDAAIALSGNLQPLFEAWSPSKRAALRLLAEHGRRHAGADYPPRLAKKLMEGIAMAADPADPLGEEFARSLVARLEEALAAGRGSMGGVSDRLR